MRNARIVQRLLGLMCACWTMCSPVAFSQVSGSETKEEIDGEDWMPKVFMNATYLEAGNRLISINYERMVGEELSVRIGVALPLDRLFNEQLPMPAMVNFLFPILGEQLRAEFGLGFLFAIGFEDNPAPIRDLQDSSGLNRVFNESNAISFNGYPAACFALRIEPLQNNVLWRFAVTPFTSPVGLRWNFSASIGFRF